MSAPPVIKRPPIYKLFLIQFVITLALALGFYLIEGKAEAISALLGGLIFCLPQLYFAVKAYSETRPSAAQRIVSNFYLAMSSKLLLIGSGFAVVLLTVKTADYFALFFTFVALVVVNPVVTTILR